MKTASTILLFLLSGVAMGQQEPPTVLCASWPSAKPEAVWIQEYPDGYLKVHAGTCADLLIQMATPTSSLESRIRALEERVEKPEQQECKAQAEDFTGRKAIPFAVTVFCTISKPDGPK